MTRIFLVGAAMLLGSMSAFAQYTNLLENGTEQTVTNGWSTSTIRVGNATPSNALYVVDGGAVSATNVYVGATSNAIGNTVSVSGSGSLTIEDTLEIGTGTNNSVAVGAGGALSVGNLVIHSNNTLSLDADGTFAVAGDFDASTSGFIWNDGGHLSVQGDLTGMAVSNNNVYLDGGRDLTIDGGTWLNGTNDLAVGWDGSSSTLAIINGGRVESAHGFIGWTTNASNNAVIVDGTGSEWRNTKGLLQVGLGSGSGNALMVSNAAWVYVGEVSTNDFDAGAAGGIAVASTNSARLIVDDGSAVETSGGLYIGSTDGLQAGTVELRNNGSVAADNLSLYSGSTLSLESGGSAMLGTTMNVYSNSSIAGTGTIGFGAANAVLAFHGGDIALGTGIVFVADAGFSNTVSVSDGRFTVSDATSAQYLNFSQLTMDNSILGGLSTLDAFEGVDMTGGVIDPLSSDSDTARLVIAGDFSSSGTVYRAQVYDNRWDELVFSGPNAVDLSGLEADVLVVSAPTGVVAILSSATNLIGGFAATNIEDRLLLYNAVMQVAGNEVQIALEADPLESSMEYAATEMARAGFSGMKNAVFTRTKQMRRNLVSTAHAIPHETYLLTNTNAPAGAMGPGDQNTIFDMHVWMQQYSGQGDFDTQGQSDGYTLNNQGTTIGADRLVGEALTLGFNYTYARSSARTIGMDDVDAESYWVGGYGEWVGEDGLYVDALAAYGRSNYDSMRREENYRGRASYRGTAFGAYADVGQYYHHRNLSLSPYAGIHLLSILTDGHNETDELGSTVYVGEVNRDLAESTLGLKMRHRFDTTLGRFQTTGYAEWAHDFIEDDVSATLSSGGFPPVTTGNLSPDADSVNVGLGYSWISTDYMEIGVGYTGRFSENYEEHTGALMLDIMF